MGDLVLAFDTATDRCALALARREAGGYPVIAVADFDAPRAALGRLLPAVGELLAGHGFVPRDISEVVVGRGPGSFTGVRIGVATAKGLSHGLGRPLYGVGTLDAIAWGCAAHAEGLLGVVGDAMRGEVYPALFRLSGGTAERLTADKVVRPDALAEEWAALGEPLLLAGGGLRKHGALMCAGSLLDVVEVLPDELWLPGGAGLLAAYRAALCAEAAGDGNPALLLPIYTRLSDAEEAQRVSGGMP